MQSPRGEYGKQPLYGLCRSTSSLPPTTWSSGRSRYPKRINKTYADPRSIPGRFLPAILHPQDPKGGDSKLADAGKRGGNRSECGRIGALGRHQGCQHEAIEQSGDEIGSKHCSLTQVGVVKRLKAEAC